MNLSFWLICIGLIMWIYWLWSRRKFYALAFKISGPVGLPFLGVALKLMRQEEILETIHLHSEKYGSLMFSWLGPYPFLVVTEPDIVHDILTSPHCINKSHLYQAIDNGTGKGLFGLEDPQWSIHRKHLNPAFSHKVILSYLPIFNEESSILLNVFDDKIECADIITILQDFSLNTAIRTTMGKKSTHVKSGETNEHLLQCYQCVVENMMEMTFSPWLVNDVVRKLFGIYEPFQKSRNDIQNFIRKEKLSNEYNRSESTCGKNIFIDQAIELMRKDIFTWQNVEDESNVIVLGAFETTANTIGYVLILLAMFPEYQEKAFEELFSIFPQRGKFNVTYENLQNMVYIDMILHESMRVMAPVPIVARQNCQDVQLSNGIVLPAGVQIALNIFTMHRRKDIWGPNAHLFNPENFLPSNMEGRHPFAFIPFTKGLRNCIGWRYGLLLAKVALAKLLRNYKFATEFKYEDLKFIEGVVLKLKKVPLLSIVKREV
ncbi:cytochrome P450 313a4 isoform X2 [Haematobia irritans]|uniref:cytochrome P450 313a4 isoform X2 n=1 Tax=Haematobia irritans TaxID=7368 RepID=UPI003F507A34